MYMCGCVLLGILVRLIVVVHRTFDTYSHFLEGESSKAGENERDRTCARASLRECEGGTRVCIREQGRVHALLSLSHSPRVEWRALKIGGGNLIHRKVVFCIFRCAYTYLWMYV